MDTSPTKAGIRSMDRFATPNESLHVGLKSYEQSIASSEDKQQLFLDKEATSRSAILEENKVQEPATALQCTITSMDKRSQGPLSNHEMS